LTLFLLGPPILLACLYPASVYAETVPAECIGNTAKWTYNSHNLSPCNVSRALEDACFGNLIYPDKLDPSGEYLGPDENISNPCDCSSVLYVLLSACALCQNGAIDTWADYSVNCRAGDITIGRFPLPFPKGITIPAWAFVDVTVDNLWIPSKAEAMAGKSPDLAANPPTPSSSVSTSSTTASPLSTTTQAALPTTPSTHKNSQTGSIAGGVAGGLAAVGILMIGIVLFLRYRKPGFRFKGISKKRREYPSEPYTSEYRPRLYNPEDPSTFPGGKSP